MNIRLTAFIAAVATLTSPAAGKCPFGYDSAVPTGTTRGNERLLSSEQCNDVECETPDYDAIKDDLLAMMTDSKTFWPADFGHYGPFFVRLAWHCNGTYRKVDGRGGCDGARVRFDPERSWEDNGNFDKALKLLDPIKSKYGAVLSWGDLIVLAGNVAIESMGGPVLGFCGGRRDDVDGTSSLQLGPTSELDAIAQCDEDGKCGSPFGTTTNGLIYVEAEGPMGNPDPQLAANEIRDTFARMDFDDRETVALVAGGHTFGKMHGACPTGPGTCAAATSTGTGNDTFTTGYEGQWNRTPTQWSLGYIAELLTRGWELYTNDYGKKQWHPTDDDDEFFVRMLTTDVAMVHDSEYNATMNEFFNDPSSFDEAFAESWYKLTTLDMGPIARCKGNDIPSARTFQDPLPEASATLPDFDAVRSELKALIYRALPDLGNFDVTDLGSVTVQCNGALFINAAWQCASTFRVTDYRGGCNGAKIRFEPQKDWSVNAGVDKVIAALEPIKDMFPDVSMADLIVLAGDVAIEEAGGVNLDFIGGRVDAEDGSGSEFLAPREYYTSPLVAVHDNMKVMGLTPAEWVALAGRPRSPTQQKVLGYSGSYSADPSFLSNEYFKLLLNEEWIQTSDNEYKADGKDDVYMLATDIALIEDAELLALVEQYAASEDVFKLAFGGAWSKFMKADHFSKTGY